MKQYILKPIGKVRNDGDNVFIELSEEYIPALQGLDGFSHIDIVWWFSNFDTDEMRFVLETPQPYKNSPEKMGIFATRSPIRPNPIALSTAEVIHIDYKRGIIQITFIDADDCSPVLDIKPYTPSLDRVETPSVPEWCSNWPKSIEQSAFFDWEEVFNF